MKRAYYSYLYSHLWHNFYLYRVLLWKRIIFISTLLYVNISPGQNSKIQINYNDTVLPKSSVLMCLSSIDVVDKINHLSRLYRSRDIYKALDLALKAKQLSNTSKYAFGEANALRNLANAHNMLGNYTDASKAYHDAMGIYKTIKTNEATALAILMREQCKTWLGISELSNEEKIDTLSHAITLLKNSDDFLLQGDLYDRLSKTYYCNTDEIDCQNKIIKGIECLKKAKICYEKIKFLDGINGCDLNTGIYYLANKRYDLAKSLIQKGIMESKKSGNLVSIAVGLGNLALLYKDEMDFQQALVLQTESFQIVNNLNWPVGYTGACSSLMSIYENLQDYKNAYHFAVLRQKMQDSIVTVNQFQQINHIHQDYTLKTKDEEIQELNLRNQLHEQEIKNKQNLVIASIIVFLLLIIFGIIFYIQNKKTQKIKELEALLNGQESERKRISEELHDGLGGILATLKLNLNLLDLNPKTLNGKELQAYENAKDLIDKAVSEVREISHNLLPPLLQHFGLKFALSNLVQKLNNQDKTNFILDFIDSGSRFNSEIELHIYRIVIELIHNVIKHANAKHAYIRVIEHDRYISLMVEDDGIGITDNENFGLGIKNVKSRLKILKAEYILSSNANEGTLYDITIPKNYE